MLLEALEINWKTEPHDYKHNPLLKVSQKSCGLLLKKFEQKAQSSETFMVNKNAIFEGSGDEEITVFWRWKNTVVPDIFQCTPGGSKAETARKLFLPTAVYSLKWTYVGEIRKKNNNKKTEILVVSWDVLRVRSTLPVCLFKPISDSDFQLIVSLCINCLIFRS